MQEGTQCFRTFFVSYFVRDSSNFGVIYVLNKNLTKLKFDSLLHNILSPKASKFEKVGKSFYRLLHFLPHILLPQYLSFLQKVSMLIHVKVNSLKNDNINIFFYKTL